MLKQVSSLLPRYGFALAVVALAAALILPLAAILGPGTRGLVFTCAVVVSTWYGGLGPGLLTTFLSGLVAECLWLPLEEVFAPDERWGRVARIALFWLEGGLISVFGQAIRTSRSKIARDLAERQMRAEGALRETNRRKLEFLATLSHELRGPLAPLRNALHLMSLIHLDDEMLVEARSVMDRQVQLLAGLVDDLLDIFNLSHHEVVLRKEPIDLGELVRQVIEDRRGTLEGAGLGVVLEIPQGPVWVTGDHGRLSQVLGSLLGNAAKFSSNGGRVTVNLAVEGGGQQATIRVHDTGIGIAPELLPHVFEMFPPVEQNLDRKRGLGRGLALVKGLVERHGGGVRAASPGIGQGAEIVFWLPLASPPQQPPAAPPAAGATSRRLRILIIEDNPDTARTLGVLLTRYGHEVATAHTGLAGVEAARKEPPDVVLCDLGLPEMDGFAVARALRRNPTTAPVRLIAVSGFGQDEDRRLSEEAGFDLHLTKPVDPLELRRLLTSDKEVVT
jgi:signal transduction histidine kinase